jgi:hypothetical protein
MGFAKIFTGMDCRSKASSEEVNLKIIRTLLEKEAVCERCGKIHPIKELNWFCDTDKKFNWMKCVRGEEYPHSVYFICKKCI